MSRFKRHGKLMVPNDGTGKRWLLPWEKPALFNPSTPAFAGYEGPRSPKPTLYDQFGHEIPQTTDRNPPPAKLGAGIGGWVSWGLYDRQGRQVQGGEQHNLILNGFLDAFATLGNATYGFLSTGSASLAPLSHFAVGTGSAEPEVTDTALDNELARTTTVVGSPGTARPSNGVYELSIEREFDFGVGNGNLTEFGFSTGVSADILVRELFRNEGGDPIVITKTSSFKLRIKYTLTLTLSPVTMTEAGFTITGIGAVEGDHMLFGGGTGGFGGDIMDLQMFLALARGGAFTTSAAAGLGAGVSVTAPSVYTTPAGVGTDGNRASAGTFSSYSAGSYERTLTSAVWDVTRGNVTIRTLGANTPHGPGLAWAFVLDVGDAFTKDNLHQLTIDNLLTVAWDREA